MNALELNGVCKSFGQIRAVDNLTARIPAGSIYGFLGPNGAGKTTTLRMIMNIIRPDTGSISVFTNGSIEQANSRIGYMPEERGLYRKMTVSKTLAFFGALKGLSRNELARSVPSWLKRIELSDWANKKVEDLSRGMHQKLQFAVTVINEPDLLILDEPFSGLDPLNLDLLKNIILEMKDKGHTIIFSTHAMHEAESLCDSILLINKGKVILDGKLNQIRSQKASNAVIVEVKGDTGFIETLPIVTKVLSEQNRLEITLGKDADPQDLLKALVGRVRVQKFEVKMPSLHEIFVTLVGASNAQNS
ncbi:MAG: ATP-binding cassette domain-containing protein [Sedimentisphaerales bacterium]|nr:ATP-binding cassette domain-containing protein [Sedimentisphaerales bacterium]